MLAQARNPDAAEATRPFAINGARLADRYPADLAATRAELLATLVPSVAARSAAPSSDAAFVCELALVAHERRDHPPAQPTTRKRCSASSRSVSQESAMERELLITGIGGQGVQLCAQVLARAATLEGREVMYLGLYGGMMRGGNTDSTVVVADAPILAPPVVSRAWCGDRDARRLLARRSRPSCGRADSSSSTTPRSPATSATTSIVHRVPATTVATDLGSPLSGSMVMLGAFCTTTGIVSEDALVEAMRASIPSYRTQHIEANERALRAGAKLLPADEFPAWETANV